MKRGGPAAELTSQVQAIQLGLRLPPQVLGGPTEPQCQYQQGSPPQLLVAVLVTFGFIVLSIHPCSLPYFPAGLSVLPSIMWALPCPAPCSRASLGSPYTPVDTPGSPPQVQSCGHSH